MEGDIDKNGHLITGDRVEVSTAEIVVEDTVDPSKREIVTQESAEAIWKCLHEKQWADPEMQKVAQKQFDTLMGALTAMLTLDSLTPEQEQSIVAKLATLNVLTRSKMSPQQVKSNVIVAGRSDEAPGVVKIATATELRRVIGTSDMRRGNGGR
jgi:hypothetical protein